MASGDSLLIFSAQAAQLPSTNHALFSVRNNHALLVYDDSADETAYFTAVLPNAYNGGGLTVTLYWVADTATSGDVVWDVAFERLNTDIDSDSFATAQSATDTTNATSGIVTSTTIIFTDGAQIDSLTTGELFRILVRRDADNGSDTMSGDAQLLAVAIEESL